MNKGLQVARGKTKILYEKLGQPDVLIVQALDNITAGDGARRNEISGTGRIAGRFANRPSDYVSVSVAALELAKPAELVNTARTCQPFSKAVCPLAVSVVEVAPLMSAHVLPWFVEYSHCTAGVGVPLAAAV